MHGLASLVPLLVWSVFVPAPPGDAPGAALERAAGLPAALPDWLPPLLDPDGVRVHRDGGAKIEIWTVAELPSREPTGELGIEFPSLPPGSLIGLVRFDGEWSDYKAQRVPSGLYTLRYGVQPADGDHTGQSWYRDFLMLVPPDRDVFLAEGVDQDLVAEASKGVAGGSHPAVVAMFPVYEAPSEPTVGTNGLGQPLLVFPREAVVLGLVLEGHGEEVDP